VKSGLQGIIIAVVTGLFSSIAVVVNSKDPLVAIIVFVITIVSVYLFVSFVSKKAKTEVHDPLHHPVFYNIERFLQVELYSISISDPIRKRLITMFLEKKIKMIKLVLIKALETGNIECIPKELLYINKKVKDELGDTLPDIFFAKISKWDSKHNSWALNTISRIIDSDYYTNKDIRTIAIFDCVQAMLQGIIVATETTLNSLNGEIEAYFRDRKNE